MPKRRRVCCSGWRRKTNQGNRHDGEIEHDRNGQQADGDMVPAACPHLSPLCPHASEPKKPNEINVSPVSPRVPSFLKQDAAVSIR